MAADGRVAGPARSSRGRATRQRDSGSTVRQRLDPLRRDFLCHARRPPDREGLHLRPSFPAVRAYSGARVEWVRMRVRPGQIWIETAALPRKARKARKRQTDLFRVFVGFVVKDSSTSPRPCFLPYGVSQTREALLRSPTQKLNSSASRIIRPCRTF